MNITLKFDSSAPEASVSGLSAVTAYFSNTGTSATSAGYAVYTPSSFWSLISAQDASAITALSAEAMRTFWVNIPLYVGSSATVFTDAAYIMGTAVLIASAAEDTTGVTSAIANLTEGSRVLKQMLLLSNILDLQSGSTVVNTVLNEKVIYVDTVTTAGSATPKTSVLARYKLYDAYGNSSSINPVICEAYEINLGIRAHNQVTTGALSAFV